MAIQKFTWHVGFYHDPVRRNALEPDTICFDQILQVFKFK